MRNGSLRTVMFKTEQSWNGPGTGRTVLATPNTARGLVLPMATSGGLLSITRADRQVQREAGTSLAFVGKVMSLFLNILSRLVKTFLPRSKCLLISWLQSPSAVILEPRKIKSDTVSTI